MYLNPKRHAAITGAPVKIGSKPGPSFRAFDGALSGRMLFTLSGRLILFAYLIPCMHSLGSMTPRLLTIVKLPLFAWAMYMFIRT